MEALGDSGFHVGSWLVFNTIFFNTLFEPIHLTNLPVVIPSTLAAFQSPSRLSGSISTYTWLSCGNNMSNLVVIGFPKVEEAEQVRLELVAIQEEHLITLEDAVVLEHGSDGHVHLRQAINMTAAGAMGGSFWGLLIGLIFANPLLGVAAGASAGAASGALSDIGINDKFLKELTETLPQGSAALALLVRDSTPDRVIERLRRHVPNARLVHTSLSHTDEEKLKEQLEHARKQAEALRMA